MVTDGLRICVIGGGSSYTPELIEGFIEKQDELPVHSITLMDNDPRKLEIVGGLAQRMVEAANTRIKILMTNDLEHALEDAAFIINQIRVGGMEARILDEKIPLQYGVIGQETTGPGGFAKALRTIPVALRIAQTIERLSPEAFLINFTNPAGLITEALVRYSPVSVIGLCNLPIGAEMRLSKRLAVARNRLRLDWLGLNHLNWIRGATLDGVDIWDQVFQQELAEAQEYAGDGWHFSVNLLEDLGMIPCGYLNYYYNHDLLLAKQMNAAKTRGEEVQEIEDKLMEMYLDPELMEKPKLLEERGGAYYSKAAVDLISAIANDKEEIHIVNTVNRGAIGNLPAEVVVEVPCMIDGNGAHPLKTDALPVEIRGLVQVVKSYEELTAVAGTEGSRRQALLALLAHPLTPSYQAAQGLLDSLLTAHRAYLPQFYPDGV